MLRFLALVAGGRARLVRGVTALHAATTPRYARLHDGLTLLARYLVSFASVFERHALVYTRGVALHRHEDRAQLQPSQRTAATKSTHSCNQVNAQ